ncbi:6-phosphogluconolactonase [Pseudogulbenkiania subflava]|uniref:6-phosphogluconolactonase n=1 Tax=Pseudogulbenkiania subflava DSM 22618 TaxID=1123014 RepID=A0A1Y6BCJ4_9NEIS|nr:6-phosphogluconolactonase [Pseudogulbenkiania subflava]SME93878.1 6-phosphogluconolactonase [Pseudogulbenkiania subflava DSM 22618]
MQWFEFDSAPAAAAALAEAVSSALATVIRERGEAVLAVSGGRSPVAFLQRLAQSDLDWSRLTVTLVDERLVPEDHADSNAALVRQHLLTGAASAARFLPLAIVPADATASLAAARAAYRQPDVTVLGMGDDGHTASLFPDAAELAAGLALPSDERLIAVTPPAAPHQRLSMTLAALLASGRLFLAIQGETKRRVFEQARQAVDDALPISHVLHHTEVPLDVYWAS